MSRPTAIVYVDGFNLYHGLVKGTPYKWLNLVALFDDLMPDNDVKKVRYFTADLRKKASPDDPGIVGRQQVFIRALLTLKPRFELHKGHFEVQASRYPRRWDGPPELVDVWRPEEKGSDVNLGANLVRDAFLDAADVYVVVTNDADLVEAVRIVSEELGRSVWFVFPHGRLSKHLMQVKHDHVLWISEGALARAQFPDPVTHHGLELTKPEAWKEIGPSEEGPKPGDEAPGVVLKD